MRKILIFLFCLAAVFTYGQKQFRVYGVGFYNQENLFDTCHDEGKNDYEYLPNGANRWGEMKYKNKLRNMARALADMGTDMLPNVGCAVIGLSEVENSRVLDDLVAQEPLRARGYKYVHVGGPDIRGIDCALLYNPALFTLDGYKLLPYVQELEKDSAYFTRGFLTISGTMAGEHVVIIVCHWPSRFSGPFYRESAGRQVRMIKDSVMRADTAAKVIVMGDMNDDPMDKSMCEALGAKAEMSEVGPGDMYNPWYNTLAKKGQGTLCYQGSWNLFDQIVVSPNLISGAMTKDYSTLTFLRHKIQKRDYLMQTEGKYKGTPKRTHAGGVWLNGYSDHLPVAIYLVKEK